MVVILLIKELLLLLEKVEEAQKHYNFLYGQFQDSKEKKRFEQLKHQIGRIEKNMLTTDEYLKVKQNSSYQIGMEYLTTAITSTNLAVKKDCVNKSFEYFTEVIGTSLCASQKKSYNVEMQIVTCYWGRYIYFALHNDWTNMLKQVFEGVKVSPSFSLMFFPHIFFNDEELKMMEMEMEIIEFQKYHQDMKKLNETVRYFGSFYHPSEVSANYISILKVYDRLDKIDLLNQTMKNRAIWVLQRL